MNTNRAQTRVNTNLFTYVQGVCILCSIHDVGPLFQRIALKERCQNTPDGEQTNRPSKNSSSKWTTMSSTRPLGLVRKFLP